VLWGSPPTENDLFYEAGKPGYDKNQFRDVGDKKNNNRHIPDEDDNFAGIEFQPAEKKLYADMVSCPHAYRSSYIRKRDKKPPHQFLIPRKSPAARPKKNSHNRKDGYSQDIQKGYPLPYEVGDITRLFKYSEHNFTLKLKCKKEGSLPGETALFFRKQQVKRCLTGAIPRGPGAIIFRGKNPRIAVAQSKTPWDAPGD
jgi:hypothetical protein